MGLVHNPKEEEYLTGICGASSLVGYEHYLVVESSGLMILADDDNGVNATGGGRICVLTKGAGVGELVEYAPPGREVLAIVVDSSAAIGANLMASATAGKLTALSGSAKYACAKLLETVSAANQIVRVYLLDKPGVGA